MFPNIEQEILFQKFNAIQDLIRIAYAAEGDNRARLFDVARNMIGELADLLAAKSPATEEDE